ncbi:MAG: IclR family transcriptional regulator domain-containing protein, partial [Nitrososphaeraceae archaeon]
EAKYQIIRDLISKGEINDLEKLEDELKIIKKLGIAITIGETTKGTFSVAAPIFSWENKVVASISVGGPETRFRDHQAKSIISETKRAAEEISEELGWMKPR